MEAPAREPREYSKGARPAPLGPGRVSADNGPMTPGWKAEQLKRPSLAPRHWGGWLQVAIVWILGKLPRGLGRRLVSPLGPLMLHLLSSRRRIAERNIEVCLPELDASERQALLRESFHSLARMLAEMAWCWADNPPDIFTVAEPRGFEHLAAATAEGRGVLVVTAHVTCLEIGARVLAEQVSARGVYRPLGNPVMEWYQNRGRARYADGMITKRDMRSAVRYLREGGVLWYAPDQDFGAKQSAFAPFFGVDTATLLATHRLPRMTGCRVLTMMPRYVAETGRYVVDMTPALEDYPSDDPWLNPVAGDPSGGDVMRALRLYRRAVAAFALLLFVVSIV